MGVMVEVRFEDSLTGFILDRVRLLSIRVRVRFHIGQGSATLIYTTSTLNVKC